MWMGTVGCKGSSHSLFLDALCRAAGIRNLLLQDPLEDGHVFFGLSGDLSTFCSSGFCGRSELTPTSEHTSVTTRCCKTPSTFSFSETLAFLMQVAYLVGEAFKSLNMEQAILTCWSTISKKSPSWCLVKFKR
jgi:hypothetical protein